MNAGTGPCIGIGIGIGIGICCWTMGGSRTIGLDMAEPVGEMKSTGAIDDRRLMSMLGV